MRRIVGLAVVLAVMSGTAQAQKKEREPVVRGKTVATWIESLEDRDTATRFEAIRALSDAGPEARKGAPGLIGVFRDKDATFLHPLAAVTLARIGPDAVPELNKGLQDKSDAVKGGCALALGMMGQQAGTATKALSGAMTDKSNVVRFAVAQALGRIGTPAKTAAPALKKALEDDDASVRVEAASALWKVAEDNKGIDVLLAALDGDAAPRAIEALGEMGTEAKSAAKALKKVAQKDKSIVRRIEAAEAWHRVSGDAEAFEVVSMALKDKDAETRLRAVAALGTLGANEKAVEALVGLLDDKEAPIRREAACSLCERGVKLDLSAVKALLARLGDSDLSVRWWAALALLSGNAGIGKLDEELLLALRIPFRPAGGMKKHPWTAIQETTAPVGQRATAALVRVLKERPLRFAVEAARTLALLGVDAREARPALIEALKEDKPLRRAAADALGQSGTDALPELVRLLGDTNRRYREGAARALGQMGVAARGERERLKEALKDPTSEVRVQAALALWLVDQDDRTAVKTLEEVLENARHEQRWEAVEAVGIIAVARDLPYQCLLDAAKDADPAVKVQAIRWRFRLSRKPRQPETLLRHAMTDRDGFVRRMAIEALGETASASKAAALLLPALEDDDVSVRLAAEETLARGGKPMVPHLIEGAKERFPRTRAGIARALGMIGPDAKDAVNALMAMARDKKPALKAVAYEALLRISGGKEEEVKNLRELNELLEELEDLEEKQHEVGNLLRQTSLSVWSSFRKKLLVPK